MNGNSDISQWTLPVVPVQPSFGRLGQLGLIGKIVPLKDAHSRVVEAAREPEPNRTVGEKLR